jgi:D-alanyl-D-alanine dipeptidase
MLSHVRRLLLLLLSCTRSPVPDPEPEPVPDGLVDVTTVVPDAVLDIRYASSNNLTGAPIYDAARCLLAEEVAARLVRAADTLRDAGYRLVLWDCYRPRSAQQVLWDRVPDPDYVMPPARGSVHSRAAAVDVSLADLAGAPLAMPTDHDDFSKRAHRGRRAKDPDVRARMEVLDAAMTAAGFVGIPSEWWHYDAPEGSRLPLRDDPLR